MIDLGQPAALYNTGFEVFTLDPLDGERAALSTCISPWSSNKLKRNNHTFQYLPRTFSPTAINCATVSSSPLMPPTTGHTPSYSIAWTIILQKS